jgi:transcriptional regulator with XRE-family HTH domain
MAYYGSKVKQRRKELGWTQGQLADRAGVSTAIVSLYERNMQVHPSLLTVRRLEVALGVDKGAFFD